MELLFEYPYVWGRPDNYKNLVEKDSMEYSFANENKPILLFSMHMGCVDTMLLMSEKNKRPKHCLYTSKKSRLREAN